MAWYEFAPFTSSNIAKISYDEDQLLLEVEFHNGGRYQYYEVPPQIAQAFDQAGSKGSSSRRPSRVTIVTAGSKMPLVSLDQKNIRVQFGAFEVDNKILFEFFNKLAAADRDEQLHKALYIGVLALMEDRLSSFLSRTANELGTELESLKLIFDMKKELFYRSAVKGVLAEADIADFLSEFSTARRSQTGSN